MEFHQSAAPLLVDLKNQIGRKVDDFNCLIKTRSDILQGHAPYILVFDYLKKYFFNTWKNTWETSMS